MHAHQHWRSRALTVVIGCLVALSAAACGAGADASSLLGALPGAPGCEDPELVEVPAEAAAPIQDMFADAVAAKGVDVSTVVTARTPAGAGGECAEMLTVTVSGAGPGGETTNVQLSQEGGDSVDEDGPRGVYVYENENGEECAAAAAASGYGAWAVRSTGAGPSGEDLFQLASFEYWADLLPPR